MGYSFPSHIVCVFYLLVVASFVDSGKSSSRYNLIPIDGNSIGNSNGYHGIENMSYTIASESRFISNTNCVLRCQVQEKKRSQQQKRSSEIQLMAFTDHKQCFCVLKQEASDDTSTTTSMREIFEQNDVEVILFDPVLTNTMRQEPQPGSGPGTGFYFTILHIRQFPQRNFLHSSNSKNSKNIEENFG